MAEGDRPQPHPVQLAAVTATAVDCRHRRRRDTDPESLAWEIGDPRLVSFSRDGLRFACQFRAGVTLSLETGEVWQARITLRGDFVSSAQLKRRDGLFFAASSAVFVLLPFARAYLMQISSLADVKAPPLPLVIRPPVVVGPSSRP
jgi:hypothetical protein